MEEEQELQSPAEGFGQGSTWFQGSLLPGGALCPEEGCRPAGGSGEQWMPKCRSWRLRLPPGPANIVNANQGGVSEDAVSKVFQFFCSFGAHGNLSKA